LKRKIWKIYLSDVKRRGGGGGANFDKFKSGELRERDATATWKFGNHLRIFQFIKPKISAFARRHRKKPRKSGPIRRKKVIALPYPMVSDFQKKMLFESSQAYTRLSFW
jgi:hypothetical protein